MASFDYTINWSNCRNIFGFLFIRLFTFLIYLLILEVNLNLFLFNKYPAYVLTGHGPFPCYLNRLKITSSANCKCGNVGDADPYLFSCPLTSNYYLIKPLQQHERPGPGISLATKSVNKRLKRNIWLVERSAIEFHWDKGPVLLKILYNFKIFLISFQCLFFRGFDF